MPDSFPRGTKVDIWFEPSNKDITGWKGPAEVQLCQPDRGQVTVKWQGRVLDRRAAEVRPHVIYLLNEGSALPLENAWSCLRSILESRPSPSTMTVGHIHTVEDGRWSVVTVSDKAIGHVLLALLDILVSYLGFHHPVALRWTRGLQTIPHLQEYQACEIWSWRHGQGQVQSQMWLDSEEAVRLRKDQVSVPALPLRHWAIELSRTMSSDSNDWTNIHFLQWWHTPHDDVDSKEAIPPLVEQQQFRMPGGTQNQQLPQVPVQPNTQQPTPMETQNDPPAPDGPPRGDSTKLQDTRGRSRSRDMVAERSSGPQPPPQPPPAPPAPPARDRTRQFGSSHEQARSMSRSSLTSDHTDRTRSRGNNSEMSTTEITGNGRPPPPDQPPRG
eukprot:6491579-Amphidinium_carterae.2